MARRTKNKFTLFCWNIGNPSLERAGRQAEWLRKKEVDLFVLTECKRSEGCLFLERYFQAYGYNVIFPKPEEKEFGVMIISKHPLKYSDFSSYVDYLNSRVAAVKLSHSEKEFEVIGIYVPSRDSSPEKKEKKKHFLNSLQQALEKAPIPPYRIFCGDFNILEPEHIPHYSIFEDWEYNFYRNLQKFQFRDAFRYLNPKVREYSWVGRTGDGYRYDHCFLSANLLPLTQNCYYFHEPREIKLSDHSALITELNLSSL